MKSLDEIEHQLSPLCPKEAAIISGDSLNHFYRRIHRGEIAGVFREKQTPKARIKICPREFVAGIRQQIAACRGVNHAAVPAQPDGKKTALPSEEHEEKRSRGDSNREGEQRREDNVA